MTAPEILRLELARHRDDGRPFDTAWRPALTVALDDMPRRDQIFWADVFMRQRPVWSSAYSRDSTRELFALERDSSAPRVGRLAA